MTEKRRSALDVMKEKAQTRRPILDEIVALEKQARIYANKLAETVALLGVLKGEAAKQGFIVEVEFGDSPLNPLTKKENEDE